MIKKERIKVKFNKLPLWIFPCGSWVEAAKGSRTLFASPDGEQRGVAGVGPPVVASGRPCREASAGGCLPREGPTATGLMSRCRGSLVLGPRREATRYRDTSASVCGGYLPLPVPGLARKQSAFSTTRADFKRDCSESGS